MYPISQTIDVFSVIETDEGGDCNTIDWSESLKEALGAYTKHLEDLDLDCKLELVQERLKISEESSCLDFLLGTEIVVRETLPME